MGWVRRAGKGRIAASPSSAIRTAGRIVRPSEFSRGARKQGGLDFAPFPTGTPLRKRGRREGGSVGGHCHCLGTRILSVVEKLSNNISLQVTWEGGRHQTMMGPDQSSVHVREYSLIPEVSRSAITYSKSLLGVIEPEPQHVPQREYNYTWKLTHCYANPEPPSLAVLLFWIYLC